MNERRLEEMERDEEIRREQGGGGITVQDPDPEWAEVARKLAAEYGAGYPLPFAKRDGILARALFAAYQRGRDYEKTLYHFAGTESCRSCETGRFTLFFRTNLCIECANEMKAAIKKQQDVGE